MGTKRQLADHVQKIGAACQPGPFLDAFAGMGSVGTAIGTQRSVWSNDKQAFAVLVAQAQFVSRSGPKKSNRVDVRLLSLVKKRMQLARDKLSDIVEVENVAISTGDTRLFNELFDVGHARRGLLDDLEQRCGVFTDRYAGTYFGFLQCIEVDALRSSIENLKDDGLIDIDQWRWFVVALARAIAKVSTTTGHFAQPLRPKASNIGKFAAQRRRSVIEEWELALKELTPVGDRNWRANNRVFNSDAEHLLSSFWRSATRPSVVYADPPYTKDQYSRFYHVYETLVLNDNPVVSGEGVYRSDRFTSKYCLASQVDEAIETIIAQTAEIGADLILSYPTNGLLKDSVDRLPRMFAAHYGSRPNSIQLPHVHSTLGGSKGRPTSAVTEVIYWTTGRC
ncbi:DNA adenine methylase [Methylobacterium sp. NMS12]|uniref:DNA adenine methylase n=1 Tax=Methylobacterium sp. NMS12 TaxID=3079766 RepID=UPI003F880AD2